MSLPRFAPSLGTAVVAGAALAIAACSRSPEPAPAKPAVSSTAAATTAIPAVARLAAPKRVAALGDLHGDLKATHTALRMAGAIDDKNAWSGGDMMLVQTGDEIDRGDDDRAILDLFDRLGTEAKAAGGSVVALVGNHEVMNVQQRFDYVTKGGFQAFVGVAGANPNDLRVSSSPPEARPRAAAFLPGAPYAKMLAKRPVAVVVGDTVFVHGGLSGKHVRYGVDRINREMAAWMNGETPALPRIAAAEDAPTWLRQYSAAPDADDCKVLAETLGMLGAKRMVMGHTVQRGGITSACAEQAWRIDVGMAQSYEGRPEVLVIEGDKVSVVRSP